MKITRIPKCSIIVQPGDYLISKWDGRRCGESNPSHLIQCQICNDGVWYCLTMHWPKHMISHAPTHRDVRINQDPKLPLGTCGVCDELHNKCSQMDWKVEAPF